MRPTPERTNAFGRAIALSHPLGATGARLMRTLVHQLRPTGGCYGLQISRRRGVESVHAPGAFWAVGGNVR
ncbi:hypothetical protein NGB36_09290 [Streptomyces sp. RB6PN25]|uniref:Thiolase C-terminal domain-containing protein n=1 Tax=Streptomyces humicola TaxID=2953240 RepID=A0ABT1PSY5_9ACTN|nr:hypothetical protein [Streptomyces humicola]